MTPLDAATRPFWIAGICAGLLVWLFAGLIGTAGVTGGLFLGAVTAVLLAQILIWAVLRGFPAMHADAWMPGASIGGVADGSRRDTVGSADTGSAS